MSTERHLAAIMFTDIVGYTAMMQENEKQAATVRQQHRQVFEQEHNKHHGKILQYYGDGTLSIFKSAVEAVECAIKMQQEFQAEQKVPLRIGIHLGDIVFNDNEVYGDGVNIAARIESLGIPGSVLISQQTKIAVQSIPEIKTGSLGVFEFKNVKDPIEVFSIHNQGVVIPKRTQLKGKMKEETNSVAVLPFLNMSNDPNNEYFSDGITEEILNALVKVKGLRVTARTSSFSFKGKQIDIREIGNQLGVAHILEGSVRKSGNRVRITAQLIKCLDGYHLFSESYDRTLEDIFAVQDEIAHKIVSNLRAHLSEASHPQQLVSDTTLNMEVYDLYLKGLFYMNQWGEAMSQAVPYFEKAIALQEDFAPPRAKLVLAYYFSAFGGILSWDVAKEKAALHVRKLEDMQVESGEYYFSRFIADVFMNWDWPAAIETTRLGLEKFPSYASLHHCHSTLYYIKGDMPMAVATHKKGLLLDPLSIEMVMYMGIAYIWNRQFDEAKPYLNKVLEILPGHRTASEYHGWIAALEGDFKRALDYFMKLEPAYGYRLHQATCLGWVYFKQGDIEKAKQELQTLIELEKAEGIGIGINVDLSILHTCMGAYDKALDALEKAVSNKIGSIMMCESDPLLEDLVKQPGFQKIRDLIGEMPSIDIEV